MLRAVLLFAWAWVALLAGCGGDDPPIVDDGGPLPTSDGGVTSGGLSFSMRTDPLLPATVGAVVIEEIRASWRHVRAIGDSANGDYRTYRDELNLLWRSGDYPAPLQFPQAPPGRYSSLQAQMGGGGDGYRLEGKVVLLGGETVSFEIRDDTPLAIAIPLTGVAVESDLVVATLTMSLSFLADLPWDEFPLEGDKIKIEPGDPSLPSISAQVVASFSLTSVL